MQKVGIVGISQTRHEGHIIDRNFADLVYEVTCGALDDARMSIEQIDNVVTVSNDFWDGRTISSMAVTDACGSHGKNVSTVEGDGTFGAIYGAMRIWSGSFGTTLVVAHSKGSEGSPHLITNAMFDPIYQRPIGLDAISSAGLQAKAYMDEKGARPEHWALVSVKNHGNSFKNPFAHLPLNLTVEEVLNSRLLSDPLRLLDCSPVSDGACAIVLASEDRAVETAQDPVWIKGFGYAADLHYLGDRNLAEPKALSKAAKSAYGMAGISKPRDEIDFIELYDAFSYMEPLWLEGMGFCEPGRGGMLIEKRITGLTGSLPVNASGGVLSAHPVLTAGLVRIAEAVLQLRGAANEHQVDKNRVGLAHGINGPCGQSHCVIVLSKE